MGIYIINAKFPIHTFFNFSKGKYISFSHIEKSRPMVLGNKLSSEITNTEKQIFKLADLEVQKAEKQIGLSKDIEEEISNQQELVASLLKKQKTKYSKKHILNAISKKDRKVLFMYFISQYYSIVTSKTAQFSYDELEVYKNKFHNLHQFQNILNSRIDILKLDEYVEQIKQSSFIISFDQTLFVSNTISFLNKNAFFELSESIYSIKTKDTFSYFDLEKIFGEINREKEKPRHTSTNLLGDLKISFKAENNIDFEDKIIEIEQFIKKRSRERLLFAIFFEFVKFDDSASKYNKNKILFLFFKLLVVPLFFEDLTEKSDQVLNEKFRYYRRDFLKI